MDLTADGTDGGDAAAGTTATGTTATGAAATGNATTGAATTGIATTGDGAATRDASAAEAASPQRRIRIGVVDDDAFVRSGLRLMLGGTPEFEVIAEAADGAEAITMAASHRLDVILMDVRMPRVNGLTATQIIRSGPNPPEIIILTTFNADEYVLEALRGGASGFLLKDTPAREIMDSIRAVADGEGTLSPKVIRGIINWVADPAAGSRRARARKSLAALTDREREVALALGRGGSNADIAAELGMGLPTVKGHVSRVLAKLTLNSRVQIAVLVHDAELL